MMSHRSGFGVLYPVMVADQGWSVTEISGAFAASMLIYAPAAILTGQLVDRLGVRGTMLGGAALLAAALAALGLARELWQVYLLYAVGVGAGSASVGYVPMIKALSMRAGPRLGLGIGLFNSGQGIGALVATPAVQLIVDAGGWRLGFVVLGGIVLLGLVPFALAGAPGRVENRLLASGSPAAAESRLWRRPVFWPMLVANAAVGYLLLLPTHQVAHLAHTGLPNVLAATVGGLMGACIGLGAVLGGWWADHRGLDRLGWAGAALFGLGVFALLGSGPSALWLAAVYVLAAGLGRGLLGINHATIQARAFAGPSLGRSLGVLDLGFGVGAFAGPYLTGLSYDLTASYVPGLATAILAGVVAAGSVQVARMTVDGGRRAGARAGSEGAR